MQKTKTPAVWVGVLLNLRLKKRLANGLLKFHGIGDGVLRREIEKKLSTFNFIKGSRLGEPRLYGNGATVVELDV
jgi:dsDNA-specific endonuclease/ATPase MutS2